MFFVPNVLRIVLLIGAITLNRDGTCGTYPPLVGASQLPCQGKSDLSEYPSFHDMQVLFF